METMVVNVPIISWSTSRPIGDDLIEEIDQALFHISAGAFQILKH